MAKNQEIFRTQAGRIETSGHIVTAFTGAGFGNQTLPVAFTVGMGAEGSVIKDLSVAGTLYFDGISGTSKSLEYEVTVFINDGTGVEELITKSLTGIVNPAPDSVKVPYEVNFDLLTALNLNEPINLESNYTISFEFNKYVIGASGGEPTPVDSTVTIFAVVEDY